MLNLVLAFLTVFLTACGVDTSSSSTVPNVEVPDSEVVTDSDLVVSDPIDSNPVVQVPTEGPTDEPTGEPTDEPTGEPTDEPTSEPVNPGDSDFDTVDAIEDPNACNTNTYRSARDASYSGEGNGENGASGLIIDDQGLVIRSEYLSQEYQTTWVRLYYQGFKTPNDLGVQGVTSYKMEGVFYISYDIAWADESIPNIDNRVYIQSDKGIKPACYRLDLNSVKGSELDVQKVYRLRL